MARQHPDPSCPNCSASVERTQSLGFGSLQVILWSLWTGAILVCAYLHVRTALGTREPIRMPGLIIHCVLVGLIGMVVVTMAELHFEPWRFTEPDDRPEEH